VTNRYLRKMYTPVLCDVGAMLVILSYISPLCILPVAREDALLAWCTCILVDCESVRTNACYMGSVRGCTGERLDIYDILFRHIFV
jgi:hypothetical protein